jgi:hypothetical protein
VATPIIPVALPSGEASDAVNKPDNAAVEWATLIPLNNPEVVAAELLRFSLLREGSQRLDQREPPHYRGSAHRDPAPAKTRPPALASAGPSIPGKLKIE